VLNRLNRPRVYWSCLVLLLAAIAAVHVATLRPGHGWGGDFALYVGHAKNIAESNPYAATGYLYNPEYPIVSPPTYPPGVAVLLAPIYAVLGVDIEAMKIAMIASLIAFLLAVALCFRDELTPGALLAAVALLGLNHYLIVDKNWIGSDMPFLAWTYLALWIGMKASRAPRRRRMRLWLGFGALAYAAFATRTLGVLIVPAMLAAEWNGPLALRRRRRGYPWLAAGPMAAGGLFAVLAATQSLLLHSDASYFDQFNVGPAVFLHNAIGYLGCAAKFWHNGYAVLPAALLFAAVALAAVGGYLSAIRREVTVLEVFGPLYLVAILAWPSYQGERYLYPLFPLMLLYALKGLGFVSQRATGRPVRESQRESSCNRTTGSFLQLAWDYRTPVFAALLAAATVGSYLSGYTTLDYGPFREGIAKAESRALFEFVATRTRPEDVLVFVKPRVMALFGGRTCSIYRPGAKDADLWNYLTRIGATHVAVVERDAAMDEAEDPAVVRYLREFVARHRHRFELVFANSDFTVYGVRKHPQPDIAAEKLAIHAGL